MARFERRREAAFYVGHKVLPDNGKPPKCNLRAILAEIGTNRTQRVQRLAESGEKAAFYRAIALTI
jgi:hypothetical protein